MNQSSKFRKVLWIVLVVVLGGLMTFGLVMLFLRTGGIIKAISIILALVVAYMAYELVKAIARR